MKLAGIILVFCACVFGGTAVAGKYLSVLKGVERAERLVGAMIDGVRLEHRTMSEILEGVLNTDEETKALVSSVLKNSEGKRIVLKKDTAEKSGFCTDEEANKLLEEAFEIFGKTTAEEQIKSLEQIQSSLRKRHELLLKPTYERAKLARSMGVIAGFLAVVILV